jgi:hypothetical protein
MLAANTKYSINRLFLPALNTALADIRTRTKTRRRETIMTGPNHSGNLQIEEGPVSLSPVQSPPQHGIIHAESRPWGQVLVCHTFLTTRYCGLRLWKTGRKNSR